jgi:hypothetical protein
VVPKNTPLSPQTVASDSAAVGPELDLNEANERIAAAVSPAFRAIGYPTFVPYNTPAATEASENEGENDDDEASSALSLQLANLTVTAEKLAARLPEREIANMTSNNDNDNQKTTAHPVTTMDPHSSHGATTASTTTTTHDGAGAGNGPAVREHTDWHDDILQDFDRVLARVENLAADDYARDPSRTLREHFSERVASALLQRGLQARVEDCGAGFRAGPKQA